MFVKDNTYKALSNYFKELLTPNYDEREIKSILHLSISHLFNLETISQLQAQDLKFSESDLLFFRDVVKRLVKKEPIQYILGKAYFYDLSLNVDHRVLIPRPETEELVRLILDNHNQAKDLKVLDIGTGSGCIPLALKSQRINWTISALDYSKDAIDLAKHNAKELDLNISFIFGNVLEKDFSESMNGDFDILVSNPPYIPESDKSKMQENVLDFEPKMALFVENERPIVFYESIANHGQKLLVEGGYLYFEIHEDYAHDVVDMLKSKAYKNIKVHKDMQGKDRMVVCQK